MEMINLLLAAGVDTNAQLNMRRPSNQGGRFNDPLLSTGTTPLLRALINNDTDVARLLLEKGANPNIYGMGLSPWLYAAGITSGTYNPTRGGGSGGVGTGSATVDMALLDLMLAHGADVNAQVTGAASYSGRIARALTGDPVNTTSNEGMTALHVAVRSQNASLVRYLLDKGARTDIKDASGRTPLDVLNGVPAFQPAVFADADGVVPPNPNAAPAAPAPAGAGRAGGAGGRAAAIPRRFRRFGPCCRGRRRTSLEKFYVLRVCLWSPRFLIEDACTGGAGPSSWYELGAGDSVLQPRSGHSTARAAPIRPMMNATIPRRGSTGARCNRATGAQRVQGISPTRRTHATAPVVVTQADRFS